MEIGAGTGIFTKRLLARKNIDCTVIEIDWACYHTLLEKMAKLGGVPVANKNSYTKLKDTFNFESLNATVECYPADARSFDPPGKFDFIFSSFADHHIKIQDKMKYFLNIKNNLNGDGVFIVGDEFLPEYDEKNSSARINALRSYHEHIITETVKNLGENANEFVKLERAALESGIQGLGDFKVSSSIYEKHAKSAKLEILSKTVIGPKVDIGVGGIKVYTFK